MQSILAKLLGALMLLSTALSGGAPAPTPTPTPEPAPASVLRYGISASPGSLDPTYVSDISSQITATQLFEGLVRLSDKGPVPGMAERWEVLEGGSKFRFYLREGLRWSNGEPLTAEDFVYSWTRALDPRLPESHPDSFFIIKGAQAFREADPDHSAAYVAAKSALGVKAEGARILEVELTAPDPTFPILTASTAFLPVPKRVVEANPEGWTDRPEQLVSNGPFKLAALLPWEKVTLVKNPHYWNQGAVKLDRLELWVVQDDPTAVEMFKGGELDVVSLAVNQKVDGIPATERATGPRFFGNFFEFNTKVKPFDDPRVRRALALALDRQAVVGAVESTNRPLYGIVPSGAPDRASGGDFRATAGDLVQEDLAEARRLLAEAGYPDGQGFPTVEILTIVGQMSEAYAEAAQQSWQRSLGVPVQVVAVNFSTFIDRRNRGEFTVYRIGWGGYPDAISLLELWTTTSSRNLSGYSNPTFDDLIAQAKATGDLARRMELARQAEAILLRDMPSIPLYETMGNYLRAPGVTGLYWHPQRGVDFTHAAIH